MHTNLARMLNPVPPFARVGPKLPMETNGEHENIQFGCAVRGRINRAKVGRKLYRDDRPTEHSLKLD